MTPKVKICGNTREADVQHAAGAGAHYLGLVFAESKRRIDLERAQKLMAAAPEFHQFVGVFANQPREEVERIAQALKLPYLQFHGDETSHYCSYFMRQGFQVIKAFRVKDAISLKRISEYDVDFFLLDAYSASAKGGSGLTFDWRLLEEGPVISDKLFLAGGLNCDNLAQAIKTAAPYAVDVARGVESAPGQKSPELVTRFIQIAKATAVSHDVR